MPSSTRILLSALLLAIAGCSTTPPAVYKEEKFDSTNIYSRRFEVSSTVACEAVRRTLLSQGYVIVTSSANQVTGSKSFQPRDDAHVQISFRVVCTDDDAKGDKSSIYVNALEDRYALKKVNNVASLGVGALGSLSLPFSSSDDSLVKVASETIASDKFYSRFFYLVERFLDNEAMEQDEQLEPDPLPAKPPATKPPAVTAPSSAAPETPVSSTAPSTPATPAVPETAATVVPIVPAVTSTVAPAIASEAAPIPAVASATTKEETIKPASANPPSVALHAKEPASATTPSVSQSITTPATSSQP